MVVGASEIFVLFILLIFIGIFAVWLFALIDILKSEFTGYNKIIWILVVLFIPLVGAVLYFIIGRKQKLNQR
ncbi:MAG: PLD nuclease N-terminal domain-containing protein [Thermodesulfovibrionales bacterium]|nr:PLD nuclease N-terminal domain-containing protein [Thermodesulfovibrionales bacterium]